MVYFIITVVIIGIIVGLCCWLFYTDKSYDEKVVYPLSKVKNDGASWALIITEVGQDSPLVTISDQHKLYQNKKDFRITIMQDVYWSTPGYLVKVFRNGKEIQSYPLLYLEQVDFGTIPRPDGI